MNSAKSDTANANETRAEPEAKTAIRPSLDIDR
jgi:hypothetical protein